MGKDVHSGFFQTPFNPVAPYGNHGVGNRRIVVLFRQLRTFPSYRPNCMVAGTAHVSACLYDDTGAYQLGYTRLARNQSAQWAYLVAHVGISGEYSLCVGRP